MIKLGIVMDPIANINIKKDSSFAMLLEAQRRGYELHYMEMADLYLINGEARARTRTLSVEQNYDKWYEFTGEIGRASCRERVSVRSIARDLRAVVRRRLMRSMLDPS